MVCYDNIITVTYYQQWWKVIKYFSTVIFGLVMDIKLYCIAKATFNIYKVKLYSQGVKLTQAQRAAQGSYR